MEQITYIWNTLNSYRPLFLAKDWISRRSSVTAVWAGPQSTARAVSAVALQAALNNGSNPKQNNIDPKNWYKTR